MAPRLKPVSLEQDTESSRKRRLANIEANRQNRRSSGTNSVTFINPETGEQETRTGSRQEVDVVRSRLKAGQAASPAEQAALDTFRQQQAARQEFEQQQVKQQVGAELVAEQAPETIEAVAGIPTEIPEATDLTPRVTTSLEGQPIIGGIAGAGAGVQVATRFQDESYREFLKAQGYTDTEVNALQESMLDELVLTEVQKETYRQGLTKSEEFGAFVESVPLLGGAISKYVGGLVNSPYSNVQDISDEITELGSQSTELAEKAQENKINPADAIEILENNRIELEKLEARLQLLSSTSAILRTNSDELNKIEEKIDGAKLKIFRAEQQAAIGAVKQPSEGLLWLEVQRLQENK